MTWERVWEREGAVCKHFKTSMNLTAGTGFLRMVCACVLGEQVYTPGMVRASALNG